MTIDIFVALYFLKILKISPKINNLLNILSIYKKKYS